MNTEIVQAYQSGLTLSQLSKKYNISAYRVKSFLQKNNVDLRKPFRIDYPHDRIVQMCNEGLSVSEIAAKLSIFEQHISLYLKKYNLKAQKKKSYNVTYSVDEKFFSQIDTEEKAYTLGIMFSDGCVYDHTMIIGVADREIVDNIKKFMKYEGKIELYKKNEKCKLIYKLRIKRTQIFEDLIKLGCVPNKSLILKFPHDKIPDHLLGHFIRGIFDGDGCICYYKRKTRVGNDGWVLTITGTEDVLLNIARTIGINKQSTKVTKNNTHTLYLYSKNDIIKFLNFIYKDHTVALQRKYLLAQKCLGDMSLLCTK